MLLCCHLLPNSCCQIPSAAMWARAVCVFFSICCRVNISCRKCPNLGLFSQYLGQGKYRKGLEDCYCLWGCHPDPRLGPIFGPSRPRPGSEGVPSRFAMCLVLQHFGPIQVPRWGPYPGPSWSPVPGRSFQDRAWTGRNRLLGHFRK